MYLKQHAVFPGFDSEELAKSLLPNNVSAKNHMLIAIRSRQFIPAAKMKRWSHIMTSFQSTQIIVLGFWYTWYGFWEPEEIDQPSRIVERISEHYVNLLMAYNNKTDKDIFFQVIIRFT